MGMNDGYGPVSYGPVSSVPVGCAPMKVPQIEAAIGSLVEQVDVLQKRVDGHVERIRPILSESICLGEGKTPDSPKRQEAPLAEIIRDLSARVGLICRKLTDITDRVEL